MSYPDYMKSMYAACKQEGWTLHSTDHFVRQALEHLANHQTVEISGSDADGWNVRIARSDFGPLSVGGYTLAEALAGAVLAEEKTESSTVPAKGTSMPAFRKKPVIVEAVRTYESVVIQTLEGDMQAQAGDWILKGVRGELYPCKDDIFRETYEPVGKEGVKALASAVLTGAVLAKPEQPEPVCCCGRTSYGSCSRCGQIMERAQRAAGEGRGCTVAEVLAGEKTESSTVPAKGTKSRKRLARPIWRRATV